MTIQQITALIQARKRDLGITDEQIERARNSGERRTPEKRAILARQRKRATLAGLEPFPRITDSQDKEPWPSLPLYRRRSRSGAGNP
jgi:hypothetical protein